MTFRLVNLRGHEYNSEDLKKMIINITKSQYEQKAVKKEFTGKRPSFLKDKLNFLNIKKYTNVFLISTLGRINSDKNTRYLIISERVYVDLYKILNPQIPIFYIEQPDSGSEVTTLSSWFRASMGNGFSFIDLDFILVRNNNVVIIEEKSNISCQMGYGQGLSYLELYNDVLNSKTNKKLLFISKIATNELIVKEYNPKIKNYEMVSAINNINSLNEYINNFLMEDNNE